MGDASEGEWRGFFLCFVPGLELQDSIHEEAEGQRSVLLELGSGPNTVEAKVLGDILGMARGELPLTTETLPSVWVKVKDAPAAAAIVEAFENRSDDLIDPERDDTPWQCSHCNETIEGQFTACWNCQNPRNGD